MRLFNSWAHEARVVATRYQMQATCRVAHACAEGAKKALQVRTLAYSHFAIYHSGGARARRVTRGEHRKDGA